MIPFNTTDYTCKTYEDSIASPLSYFTDLQQQLELQV